MMRQLEQYVARHGCAYLTNRTDAHGFYKSLGYHPDTHKGFKKRLR